MPVMTKTLDVIIEAIRNSKTIDEETEKKLRTVLDAFTDRIK